MLLRRMRAVPQAPAPDAAAEAAEDAALVAALKDGALDAVVRAYDRWHQRVRVLARRLLWDDAAAEDVVQEVFSTLPQAVRRFRGDSRLEAFLLAIAVNRARHHQRAAARRRRAMDRLSDEEPVDTRPARTPEQDAYRRELAQRLTRALDRLSHAHRVTFVLCEVEGMTAGEAAQVAGVPEPTVRTRLFHARRQLRELLAEEHAE
jgi:RNA polymerase sigma-70 factor (ECF subfamily)